MGERRPTQRAATVKRGLADAGWYLRPTRQSGDGNTARRRWGRRCSETGSVAAAARGGRRQEGEEGRGWRPRRWRGGTATTSAPAGEGSSRALAPPPRPPPQTSSRGGWAVRSDRGYRPRGLARGGETGARRWGGGEGASWRVVGSSSPPISRGRRRDRAVARRALLTRQPPHAPRPRRRRFHTRPTDWLCHRPGQGGGRKCRGARLQSPQRQVVATRGGRAGGRARARVGGAATEPSNPPPASRPPPPLRPPHPNPPGPA